PWIGFVRCTSPRAARSTVMERPFDSAQLNAGGVKLGSPDLRRCAPITGKHFRLPWNSGAEISGDLLACAGASRDKPADIILYSRIPACAYRSGEEAQRPKRRSLLDVREDI